MKRINLLFNGGLLSLVFIAVLFTSCNKEEEHIIFTDDAFFSALLELGVDTDENDLISFEEAEAVTYLDLTGFTMDTLEE